MFRKKILSFIIAMLMLISAFGTTAFATGNEITTDVNLFSTSDDSVSEDEAGYLGDADKSNEVNVKDATHIQKYVADISTLDEVAMVYADADRNGDVNIKDATLIQKFIAGLLDENTSVGKAFDAKVETYRYYFYLPDEWLNESTAKTGNTAGIYWWEGTNYCESWPGVPAKKADAVGVYYYDVPCDVTEIVWNNYFDGGDDFYEPYFVDAIGTTKIDVGSENYEGMIFVVDFICYDYNEYTGKLRFHGEWFCYYGNGEYGTTPVRGEGEIYNDAALNRYQYGLDVLT